MFAVKEPARVPATLPLLLEPDQPVPGLNHALSGWRHRGDALVRWPSDDRRGALAQHCVVRYYVHGVTRAELAREVGYSERQVQAFVGGIACSTYTTPVRRALSDLGIPLELRAIGRSQTDPLSVRRRAVSEAAIAVLADVPWLLATDDRPEAARVRTLARLLAAGREPLGGGA